MASPVNITELQKTKEQKVMETVAWRAGYYRANPQRFAGEVLGIHLKLFQKILLWVMMHYHHFIYCASRRQGKTFLTALYAAIRCILYPGTQIVVCSGTVRQANEVLSKIQDIFMKESPFLDMEVEKCNISTNEGSIYWKNRSWIKTRPSTDTARSIGANVIIIDEARMVPEFILNTVIKKFLGSPRHPKYLDNPEYADFQERNQEIYMTSAYFKNSWMYKKCQIYAKNFLEGKKKYFICGLPYHLSVKEKLLQKEQVIEEMEELGNDQTLWDMEMGCIWLGDTGDNLYRFEDIRKCRKLKQVFYPLPFYNDKVTIPTPGPAERRILSVDIALMKSTGRKRNDASSIFINNAILRDKYTYQGNVVYGEEFEGLSTDELGLVIMRYFYRYKCTDLVLDVNGVGLGTFDYIIKNQYDTETGQMYKALTCVNDRDMADRCKVADARPVIWSVKATADFNNQICLLLRNDIQNGKLVFPVHEMDADDILGNTYPGYKKMTAADKAKLKKAYAEMTLAEYELIKLQHEVVNGKIKVKEASGMRKDRYSSLAYNVWCMHQLEIQLRPKEMNSNALIDSLPMRRGSYNGRRI